MSFSNAAAEVATRTGAVQTTAQKTTVKTRESESTRQHTYHGEEGEETNIFGGGETAVLTASPEKKARKDARRRRASGTESRRRDESRSVSGKRRTQETEGAKRAEQAEQTEKAEKVAQTGALRRRREDWTPSLGQRTALDVLNQQARLQQASIQFDQVRRDQQVPMSAFGQQQAMLDSLINMTEMLYHQHTGDKAGEIYNRPATRQILTALKGLKDGVQPSVEREETSVRKMKKREFKARMAQIERTTTALQPVALPADYEPLDLVA